MPRTLLPALKWRDVAVGVIGQERLVQAHGLQASAIAQEHIDQLRDQADSAEWSRWQRIKTAITSRE